MAFQVETKRQGSPLQMREALLPLVGSAGYRRVLATLCSWDVLHAVGVPAQTIRQLRASVAVHGVEALPRTERQLESDSKSPIYVVQLCLPDSRKCSLICKWYIGPRQRQAAIEQRMNAYFRQRLAPLCRIGEILTVMTLPAVPPLSIAVLPYLGDTTLYDRLHQLPRHTPAVVSLLQHASHTLATIQVLGRLGHQEGHLCLTSLLPAEAPAYFLHQLESVLLHTFAASGHPIPQGATLLHHFGPFAQILATDSCRAGLYYRGSNPRNIMLVGPEQVEIDFEQDTIRTRYIDIVTLLENGLEMPRWEPAVDYPPFQGQMPFAAWHQQRCRAWQALAQYNYLNHAQIESLLAQFLTTTLRLEQQYLTTSLDTGSTGEQRLTLQSARLFRHLQYVGYCKRNELQALTIGKRRSSRHRQHFHALWAKCILDDLLFPCSSQARCLPPMMRQPAMALRHALEALSSTIQAPALETA